MVCCPLVLDEIDQADEEGLLVAITLLDAPRPSACEVHTIDGREGVHATGRDAKLVHEVRGRQVSGGHLGRRLNPSLFVLKGGCNLRFFHRSIRYSEDMDLDLGEVGADVLRDKVRDVLASRPFAQILEARGIAIERVSAPKQTETTQRWKFGLRLTSASATLPTKIECSRRGLDTGMAFGSVDPRIARDYQLPPLMVSHYDAGAALRQKIGALAGRPETQARDVFDAHHLVGSGAAGIAALGLDERLVERASANAMAIDFATFKSQVLAFLEPDDQARFDSASAWDTIVLEVVDALRGGRR